MTSLKSSLLAAIAVVVTSLPALAETFVNGVVVKVDAGAGKVTIDHEALVDLDMDAMTMVFHLADPAMVDGLAEGKAIRFVAARVNGKLTVTKLE